MGHWAIFGGGIVSARLFPSKSHLYVPTHRALLSHRAGSTGLQDAFNFIRKTIKAREKWENEDESNMLGNSLAETMPPPNIAQCPINRSYSLDEDQMVVLHLCHFCSFKFSIWLML